jgi:hypothetical protein
LGCEAGENILTASRATMDKAVRDRYLATWTRADFAAAAS